MVNPWASGTTSQLAGLERWRQKSQEREFKRKNPKEYERLRNQAIDAEVARLKAEGATDIRVGESGLISYIPKVKEKEKLRAGQKAQAFAGTRYGVRASVQANAFAGLARERTQPSPQWIQNVQKMRGIREGMTPKEVNIRAMELRELEEARGDPKTQEMIKQYYKGIRSGVDVSALVKGGEDTLRGLYDVGTKTIVGVGTGIHLGVSDFGRNLLTPRVGPGLGVISVAKRGAEFGDVVVGGVVGLMEEGVRGWYGLWDAVGKPTPYGYLDEQSPYVRAYSKSILGLPKTREEQQALKRGSARMFTQSMYELGGLLTLDAVFKTLFLGRKVVSKTLSGEYGYSIKKDLVKDLSQIRDNLNKQFKPTFSSSDFYDPATEQVIPRISTMPSSPVRGLDTLLDKLNNEIRRYELRTTPYSSYSQIRYAPPSLERSFISPGSRLDSDLGSLPFISRGEIHKIINAPLSYNIPFIDLVALGALTTKKGGMTKTITDIKREFSLVGLSDIGGKKEILRVQKQITPSISLPKQKRRQQLKEGLQSDLVQTSILKVEVKEPKPIPFLTRTTAKTPFDYSIQIPRKKAVKKKEPIKIKKINRLLKGYAPSAYGLLSEKRIAKAPSKLTGFEKRYKLRKSLKTKKVTKLWKL